MLKKGSGSLLLMLASFLYFSSAWAQSSCDVSHLQIPHDLVGWVALRDALAPSALECQSQGAFLALLGAAQLNSGALDQALKTLERALMVDPLQGGARVDYAQALYLDQQPFAALALNRALLNEPQMPPALRQHLVERQAKWKQSLSNWRHQLSVSVGRDTNLNSAPDLDMITFTIGGQRLGLQLDDDDKPKAGNTFRLFWGSRYERQKPDGEQYFQASLNSRNTPYHEFDAQQLELRAGRQWVARHSQLDVSLSSQSLYYGGDFLYTGIESAVEWLHGGAAQSCQWGVALNALHQRFPQDETLDGNELRIGPVMNCRWQRLTLNAQVQHLNNWGIQSDRVGGNREGWNTQWSLGYPLGPGRLNAHFSWARLDDEKTYSPILSYGEPRAVRQYAYALQYLYPVGRHQAVTFNVQRRAQRSNVELFEHTDTQYELGVLWIF